MRSLGIAALFLVTGCAREFKAAIRPPSDLNARDYPQVLAALTRDGQGFSGFEHKITIKATLMSPMLRKAFSLRFPEVYGHGGQVTRHELTDVSTDTASTLNFFVAVYTANLRWNDLNKPDSIWRVTLELVEPETGVTITRADPVSIERVKIDENLYTIYPYLTTFDTAYIIRFPAVSPASMPFIQEGPSRLRLRIASSFAERALDWTLEP